MGGYKLLATALFVLVGGTSVSPQSLADLARKEEERRKTITTPSKVYTNRDLRPGRSTPPPSGGAMAPGPAGTTATEPATTPPAEEPEETEVKDQEYWKQRITSARQDVERARVLADAMQTRINSLGADFVNMDDPAKRAVIERDRQRALAELDRLNKEIASGTERIAEIEEEARRANVPPGWLR